MTITWAKLGLLIPVMLVGLLGSSFAQTTQERRHLRHILLRSEADADRIMKQIEDGADFKALCRKYSLDPTTKVIGGDLGEAGPIWEPPFNTAAYGIKEINGLAKAKTQYGWHVIQLLGVKEVEIKKPPTPKQTPRAQPDRKPAGVVNNDLEIESVLEKVAFAPGEDVKVTITVRNKTDKPLNVFNPKLWPLGFIVRYQFGRLNVELKAPSGEPAGGLFFELGGGEVMTEQYRLQDYTGELENWPIVRTIWRGDVFFQRLEKSYPELKREKDYDTWKRRWRYYSSPEQRCNILPEYKKEDRWFAMLYIRSFVWVELKDPGIEGVLENFISDVRQDKFRNLQFKELQKGQFLVADTPKDFKSSATVLPANFSPEAQRPLAVSLLVDKNGAQSIASSRIAIGLDEPNALAARAVPIGDIFRGKQFVDWASDRFETASQQGRAMPQISLVNLYTLDMLPTDVQELAKLPLAERQSRDAAGAVATTRPKREPAAPAFARDLPRVKIETNKGAFVIELLEDHAPNTVANFIALTESQFFDGQQFHRKEVAENNRGFIQGGSPDGTASGGPGYRIKDEKRPDLKHQRGMVAMAGVYRKKDTAGSQFYICLDEQPQLDNEFTIFGRVLSGIEIADKLVKGDQILSVTVLRKRSHDYAPEKMQK